MFQFYTLCFSLILNTISGDQISEYKSEINFLLKYILFVSIIIVSSTRCYACESKKTYGIENCIHFVHQHLIIHRECPTDECLTLVVENEYDEFKVIRFCNTVENCDSPKFGFTNDTIIDCQVCAGDYCNSDKIDMDTVVDGVLYKPKIRPKPIPQVDDGGGNSGGNVVGLFRSISKIKLFVMIIMLHVIFV